jgi:hypothetical protein
MLRLKYVTIFQRRGFRLQPQPHTPPCYMKKTKLYNARTLYSRQRLLLVRQTTLWLNATSNAAQSRVQPPAASQQLSPLNPPSSRRHLTPTNLIELFLFSYSDKMTKEMNSELSDLAIVPPDTIFEAVPYKSTLPRLSTSLPTTINACF